VIYVGDAHQQIYAWRGAVNAMQQMPLHESRLTTSFRFGDAIADVANSLLGALNETVPLLGNPNVKSSVVNKPHTKMRDAILCRTNARAMELLLSGLVHGDKVVCKLITKNSVVLSMQPVYSNKANVLPMCPNWLGSIHGMMCMNIVKPMMVVILSP
jgi:hypothetical protein